ncbi:glycosyltransferase [Rhodococcus pyridinivorans]|uniref:glycosyltransferase n=1 Tax=Rhodococcus pyridinivorans TaxID=103816 RepID=UPI00228473CA|nr:glycosyltransferase [Rhodococcus pyridinivorans]WAL45700.1 glycosyltransferase [Rhodococcus pyridinivorans]
MWHGKEPEEVAKLSDFQQAVENGGPQKVVLLAYACDPHSGSEPGAGWAVLSAVAELGMPIDLITRETCNRCLEEECSVLGPNVNVIRVAGAFSSSRRVYVKYFGWILSAIRLVYNYDRQIRRGLVFHHATYASDWFLTPLLGVSRKSQNRSVWGPVGGSTYTPPELRKFLSPRARRADLVRSAATRIFRKITLRLLRGRVDATLALNPDSVRSLKQLGDVKLAANAVIAYSSLPRRGNSNEGKRLLFAGRLLAWKGLSLSFQAFSRLPDEWTFSVVGDGEWELLKQNATENVLRRVRHIDRMARDEFLHELAQSDVLILPSFHDSAPWVAAEAAGIGVPVVCLDVSGVAHVAGTKAYVVPHSPTDSLPDRLAMAVLDAVNKDSDHTFRGWTKSALVSVLRNSYGVK